MTDVRIYQPTKNAMQSGRGNLSKWILEYESATPQQVDSLMGWVGGGNTKRQVRMKFDSKDDAIAFAEREGLNYQVTEPKQRRILIKNYANNFTYHKVEKGFGS
ncbi:MAG: ETC complex I subunit [Rhodospirillaceae bacterium]|nr:ETC complex I subunit [Rhodospirillaceae bacterium]